MEDEGNGGEGLSDPTTGCAFFTCTIFLFSFIDVGLVGLFVCIPGLRHFAFSAQPHSTNLLFNRNTIECCRKDEKKHLTPLWPAP